MRKLRIIPIVLLALAGLSFMLIPAGKPAMAQGENILVNPSFEGQYSGYVPETPAEQADCSVGGICNTAQVPLGWKPWWKKERPTDVNPEFKPADRAAPGNRVLSGDRAAQYFSFWSTHKAGLRQTVTVPANANLQFSAWGHAWMTESDESLLSDRSGTPNMRIGIDPTGGIDPYNPAVVWSGYLQAFDTYQLFSVEAQAQGDKVTVFTFAAPSVNPNSPDYGFKHTDMYWEDASLVITGQGAAPAPAPPVSSGGGVAAAPVAPVVIVAGPAATPDANGVIYAEAQPGDSIWALAARNGLTLDEILELNDITRSHVVRTGDLFIVGYGDPPGTEPETQAPEGNDAAEGAAAEEGDVEADQVAQVPTIPPPPPATPEGISMVEQEVAGVSICLKAFDDNNQNGVHDSGEGLRSAVAFTISDDQSVVSNYVTDGDSEPFCIQGLKAGSYRVTRSSLPNEVMTTPGDHSVALTEGSILNLDFGSYMSDEPLTVADTSGQVNNAASDQGNAEAFENGDGGVMNGLLIAGVIIVVLLLVGVVIFILSSRRATT